METRSSSAPLSTLARRRAAARGQQPRPDPDGSVGAATSCAQRQCSCALCSCRSLACGVQASTGPWHVVRSIEIVRCGRPQVCMKPGCLGVPLVSLLRVSGFSARLASLALVLRSPPRGSAVAGRSQSGPAQPACLPKGPLKWVMMSLIEARGRCYSALQCSASLKVGHACVS